jgi:ubiquinone/menaquinone biosynthesis C-methylase UbiE
MADVDTTRMRDFWDDRAREDALYFVDNREPYKHADAERFWRKGEEDLTTLLGTLGLELAEDDHVVDVGCGVGRLTRVLARHVQHVTALDVSPEMLAKAQELNPELHNVEWALGDGESLTGIEDASVDAVVSHVVLQHIPSAKVQLGYVTEFGRVLKPGGWAAFGLSTDPRVHERREAKAPKQQSRRGFFKALVGATPGGQDEPEWLGAFVPLDALGATAVQAGLTLEQIEGANTQFTLVRAVKG